jgi:phenylalanyl-tRNA synthetase alpha chain
LRLSPEFLPRRKTKIVAYTVPKLTDYSAAALQRAADGLKSALLEEARAVTDESRFKAFRDRWMARKNGVLSQLNDLWLKTAPKDAKRAVGQLVNQIKVHVEDVVASAEHLQLELATAGPLANDSVDITLPGIRRPIGAEHPVMRTSREMVSVFQKLGYSVADGPVVETD